MAASMSSSQMAVNDTAPSAQPALTTSEERTKQRRVVAGTTIGTAIEWYDFFLYASVAGIVFNQIMFSEEMSRGLATIISFLSVGISFLFRPLGAFLAGHYSDRYGRRVVLVATLVLMGVATLLIGALPTYASAGMWAPALLVILRVLQGISAGGEWGSAVLMVVEHSSPEKRGLYAAGPQLGVPLGILGASGILALIDALVSDEAFMAWGWRIPFLFSAVLIIVGLYIRHGVEESPVYSQLVNRPEETTRNPIGVLFKHFSPVVFIAAMVMAGHGAVGYMTAGGFIQSYASSPEHLGLDRGMVFQAVTLGSVAFAFSTVFTGWISDIIGRRTSLLVGYCLQAVAVLLLFPLLDTARPEMLFLALVIFNFGIGSTFGQISSYYSELFPASIRSSGTSITYAAASLLGGAFAPFIAAAIVEATGSTRSVTIYLIGMTIAGFICAAILRPRDRIPLGAEYETVQASGHFFWQRDWREVQAEVEAELQPEATQQPLQPLTADSR